MSATPGRPALVREKRHSRLLLDTSVWIYHFQQHPEFGAAANRVLHDIESGVAEGLVSELSLLELIVHPLRLGRQDVADDYELLLTEFPHLVLVPATREILLDAAALRAAHGLRTPDAIHLATAIHGGATAVVTNDASWCRVREVRVIALAQYRSGQKE